MYKPIRDYAIIGNLRSAALVSKDGSIDWAPAAFINSPGVFNAILDDNIGGFWSIQPEEPFTSSQKYDGDTNVLITRFKTQNGIMEVTDFIPIETEKTFVPAEEDTTFRIHRKVAGIEGTCTVRIVFMPRFDYARGHTKLSLVDGGIYVKNKEKHGVLASLVPFEIEDDTATATFVLGAGAHNFFIFRYNVGEIVFHEEGKKHHNEELKVTKQFWSDWVHNCDVKRCSVAGKWHDPVVRSSLLLKILFFEPVGTIAAAPTTSLPETMGGMRNWDYRFTWIRDSAFTLSALFRLGYFKEAEEYIQWVITTCGTTAGEATPEKLQVMYGLQGERALTEETLDHLEGYMESRPVRIGNNAYKQKQWDIYGSVLDMVWTIHLSREQHVISQETWNTLRIFANYVVDIWQKPDEGLWEVRAEPQHFTYSKVTCWVALDRAIKIARTHNLEGDIEEWGRERDKISEEVLRRGWSEKKQSFTQSFDSEDVDASALTFSKLGFIKGDDPRMISTIKRIEEELSSGDGLLRRYTSKDGLLGTEGVFLLASFWLIDALILAGEHERAEKIFEKILSLQNHAGLFSEELNPDTKEFLGNFPQAYTHIGLINSAFNLIEKHD